MMASVAAKYQVPIILMHNREKMDYRHFVRDVLQDLFESITIVVGTDGLLTIVKDIGEDQIKTAVLNYCNSLIFYDSIYYSLFTRGRR